MGKLVLIQHQRYAHAKQFKRANGALKKLRIHLGRVVRDIARKIEGDGWLKELVFGHIQSLARRMRDQIQHQRGPKNYSLHAPEVECMGNGKVHRPYDLASKSPSPPWHMPTARQCVAHVKALPGNLYDGHSWQPSFRTCGR